MVIAHPSRRQLIGSLALLLAAPAIVRASSLMHVRPLPTVDAIEFFETAEDGTRLYTAYIIIKNGKVAGWREIRAHDLVARAA